MLIINLNSNYEKIHVHQIGWLITNKFPFNDVIYIFGNRFRNYDLIENKRDIKIISTELSKVKHIDSLKINDLRLVALFETNQQIDTLLIDVDGHCKFKSKKFEVNDILGQKLKIRNSNYNPKYRDKKRGRVSKQTIKDWE